MKEWWKGNEKWLSIILTHMYLKHQILGTENISAATIPNFENRQNTLHLHKYMFCIIHVSPRPHTLNEDVMTRGLKTYSTKFTCTALLLNVSTARPWEFVNGPKCVLMSHYWAIPVIYTPERERDERERERERETDDSSDVPSLCTLYFMQMRHVMGTHEPVSTLITAWSGPENGLICITTTWLSK